MIYVISSQPTNVLHFVQVEGSLSVRDSNLSVNTLRTGDADLRFYITTVQDG